MVGVGGLEYTGYPVYYPALVGLDKIIASDRQGPRDNSNDSVISDVYVYVIRMIERCACRVQSSLASILYSHKSTAV